MLPLDRKIRHLRRRLTTSINRWSVSLRLRNLRLLNALDGVTLGAALLMAVATLVLLVIRVGFDHLPSETHLINQGLRLAQAVFGIRMVTAVFINLSMRRPRSWGAWIVNGALTLSILAWIYPHPLHPWIGWLAEVLYSNIFLYLVLGVYAVLELCFGLMRLLDRRTNPSLILAGSFLFFILLGSVLLMLPRCTTVPVSYADSLFTATSAVCIAGLCPIDVPTTFTPLGVGILAGLIQIGGLGVLTFTSFFAIFFSGRPSVYNQLLLRDFIYSKGMGQLVPTLLYVLGVTLVVEAAGTALLYFTLPAELAPEPLERLGMAAFHSLSAFCNAGFSTIPDGMANPVLMGGTQYIYVVLSLLILAGGIGFPNLVNLKEVGAAYLRRIRLRLSGYRNVPRPVHIYDLNTKLVLVTTALLIVAGSVLFFVLEYHNTLEGMTLKNKIIQSLFNSLTPRSAGFVSLGPAQFLNTTLIVVLVLMWIGGASQSLAGGIKVNTFAAIALNLRSIVCGYRGIPAFRRNLAIPSVRRANAVVFLSIVTLALYTFVLMALEPTLPARQLLFEAVSALFTVGSSMGVTAQLSTASKLLLATAMFLGRVGVISLLAGFAGQHSDRSAHYPSDNIIIN